MANDDTFGDSLFDEFERDTQVSDEILTEKLSNQNTIPVSDTEEAHLLQESEDRDSDSILNSEDDEIPKNYDERHKSSLKYSRILLNIGGYVCYFSFAVQCFHSTQTAFRVVSFN